MMRSLRVAAQFLTRLPVPRVRDIQPRDLSASAAWFPCVGALIGLVVWAAHRSLTGLDAWIGSLAALLAWIWITGGLHIDGAADLADALGARHRRPERFLEVLKDPHVGAFGVLAIVTIALAKLVGLHALANDPQAAAALILIPAWTRYGAVVWSQTLPPLASGSGERLGLAAAPAMHWAWGIGLTGASLLWAPRALMAAPALAAWWLYLRLRVGGMNGDALGAGIEWCEAGALLLVALASG